MKLQKSIVLLAIFLISATGVAAKNDFKKNWEQSGWMKSDAKSSFKLLQRGNRVVPGAVVASVTITKDNTETVDTILTLLKKSLQITTWSKEKIDGLDFYEAFDKKSGTIYRLAHNTQTNQLSIASVQARFMLPAYFESHLWQVELLTHKKASGKASAFFQLFAPEVWAQGVGSQVTGIVNDYSARIDSSLNQNIGVPIGNVANGLNSVSQSLDSAGNNVSSSLRGLENSLNKLSSAKNVAKLAAVSGVVFGITSTLASMTTHFLVNAGLDGLRTLFYEAKSEFKPEEKEKRLKRFTESMQSFKILSPVLQDLETKVTAMSLLLSYASNTEGENLLAKLNNDIAMKKKMQTEGLAGCVDCEGSSALLSIPQLEAIKEIIQESGLTKKELQAQGCNLIDDMYSTWKVSETNLLLVRRNVMQDMSLFNGSIMEGIQEDKSFREPDKQQNGCGKIAQEKLGEVERKIKADECDRDFANPLCRQRESYLSAVASCKQTVGVRHTASDQLLLTESAAATTRIMARFSTNLENMTCDTSKPGCEKGSLDKARELFTTQFSTAANSCKTSFVASEMQRAAAKSTAKSVTSQATTEQLAVAAAPLQPIADTVQPAARPAPVAQDAKCTGIFSCVASVFTPLNFWQASHSASATMDLYKN